MRPFRRLAGWWTLRHVAKDLSGIRAQLAEQNALLARLADHFAPRPPTTDPEIVRAETGVDYVDPADQFLIQQYADRMRATIGREPTDDEILIYLSDEKTVDLHQRLVARDQELVRLKHDRGS